MTSRRAFLKAGATLAATCGVVHRFHARHEDTPLLVISSRADAQPISRLAEQLAGGLQSRHLAEECEHEALLLAVADHLNTSGRTVFAMASPATTLLLNTAFRDAKARLVEDRHLAARPLIIARS